MNRHDVARSFSGHDFAATFDRLADDVVWTLVGATVLHGRQAVEDACRSTTADTENVTTTWRRFVSTGDGAVVAVDAVGQYAGPEGSTAVSSCDIYEFDGELITAITSYTVEVPVTDDPGAATPDTLTG